MQHLGDLSNGPAGTGLAANQASRLGQLALGAGMMQSLFSAVVHIVPPLVPPPAWADRHLPCVPIVTGHNCFGAVLHPITLADFVVADVTDSMMDGYIATFPNTFASRVGKATDTVYRGCFASYMSLHCSSIFPRCVAPDSSNEADLLQGRAPPCLHLCVLPLVMCPGFWIGDVKGPCQTTSLPPMCTQAFFWNLWRLPPQYAEYDEANPFPTDCPIVDSASTDTDLQNGLGLYELELAPSSRVYAKANDDLKEQSR